MKKQPKRRLKMIVVHIDNSLKTDKKKGQSHRDKTSGELSHTWKVDLQAKNQRHRKAKSQNNLHEKNETA